MKNSLKSQGTDLNSQRIKAETIFGSRSEGDFYHVLESVIPPGSPFKLVPNVSIASVLPRTAESHREVSVLKSDAMTLDTVVCDATKKMAPVLAAEYDDLTRFQSNHKGVYGIGSGQADLDELRQFKLSKKCEWGRAAGFPIIVFPGYFSKLGPLPLASHLISVIEGECRPIDPDPVKWDRLINVIRHNAELLRRKGQKPKLVDAGQLTLQLERS